MPISYEERHKVESEVINNLKQREEKSFKTKRVNDQVQHHIQPAISNEKMRRKRISIQQQYQVTNK